MVNILFGEKYSERQPR